MLITYVPISIRGHEYDCPGVIEVILKNINETDQYQTTAERSNVQVVCKAWWRHQMETFPCHWSFVWGIHRSPANSPHKGQWRGALMFSLICAWINGWVNNREAGDLRRHRARYDVIVMNCEIYYTFSDWSYNIYLSLYTQLARYKDIVNKTAPIISTQHMQFLNRPSTRPTPIGTRLVHNGKSDFIAPSDRDQTLTDMTLHYGDVIKWNHFPSYRPLCGEFTCQRWIPVTKASDAEPLLYFLWSAPEQMVV